MGAAHTHTYCGYTPARQYQVYFDIDTVTNTQYLEKVPSGGLSL